MAEPVKDFESFYAVKILPFLQEPYSNNPAGRR
jgi:hypothetical protein